MLISPSRVVATALLGFPALLSPLFAQEASGTATKEVDGRSSASDTHTGPAPSKSGAAGPQAQVVEPVAAAHDPLIAPDPAAGILRPWVDFKSKAASNWDLIISLTYTILYQDANHVVNGGSYDLLQGRADLGIDWTLSRDGKNTGSIGFLARSGENIGTSQHFAMGNAVGDTLGIDSLQGNSENHPISVNLLYWRQSFLDDKLAFYVGKIHPNQYLDLDPFNNDETTQFLSGPFDGNASNPNLGAYSVGAAAEYQIADDWHIHGVVIDAQGASNLPPDTTFDGRYYEGLEVRWRPTFESLGKGNYRITGWHAQAPDGEAEGSGVSIGFSQEIGGGWAPFGRWGYGNPDVASMEQMISGGIANVNPFGRRGDMFGIGVAWGNPSDGAQRQEVLIETFYRLKLTDSLEFSPDVEVLLPPGDRHAESTVVILGARLKAVF